VTVSKFITSLAFFVDANYTARNFSGTKTSVDLPKASITLMAAHSGCCKLKKFNWYNVQNSTFNIPKP
jgi:hypothetical protein